MWGIRRVVGWWGWDVESPHVLADSFRANKNGCRVSWRKDGECGGGEEAGTRGLKEGGDGEERVREGSIRGRPERYREGKAREVKVSAGYRAVRIEPLGRVKGMGGSWAGRMRCAREGRTDSRRRTWVAPESARMGEGVIEHNRGIL